MVTGKAPTTTLEPARRLIGSHEYTKFLGVSRSTFMRLLAADKLLRPVRLGRGLRWRAKEVEAWIEAGCPSAAEWESLKASAR